MNSSPLGRTAESLSFPAEDMFTGTREPFLALDANWRILYVNPAAARRSGKRPGDLLASDYWQECPAVVGTEIERQLRRAMLERTPVELEELCGNSWLEIRAYPFDGGLGVFSRDITDRKTAEQKLRENEARYRALFETARDGILIVDDQGIYIEVNASFCKMLKASREELIGAHFSRFIPPELLAEAESAFGSL